MQKIVTKNSQSANYMKNQTSVYQKWVPEWLKLPLIVFALFPHLMLMSIFHANATFSLSFIGADTDDIQFLLSLMYGAVIVALLVFNRFFSFFRLRSYLILMISISIFILLALSVTSDYNLVVGLRIAEGIFGLLEGACFLPLLIGQLKTKNARIIAYFILYSIMLTGGTLTTSLLKPEIEDYGWQQMFQVIIYFHLAVLIIAVTIFNNNRLTRKYPLYQIDYSSILFLYLALQSGSFAMLYGQKLHWFESFYISGALVLFFIFSALFILKQQLTKRPIFRFEVFRYKNVIFGILLFFVFYIVRSGVNNVYAIMANVWGWPWEYVLNMQYFNVAGTLVGVVASGLLFINNVKTKYIFGLGFLLFTLDSAWFMLVFYPDSSPLTVGGPLFLHGLAQGWLFTPLVMYLITGLPAQLVGNGALVGTAIRFWTTNISFALLHNVTYLLNQKYTLQLSNTGTSGGNSRPTPDQLAGIVQKQALLLSNMEIFTFLLWLALLTAILIFMLSPAKIVFQKLSLKKVPFVG